MTSVVCISQLAGGKFSMSIKQEPETDGDAADQPEPLNLSKPKFKKLDQDELSVAEESSSAVFTSEAGNYKEELHDIKQTLKDLIQSRRLAEGKNILTPVDLVSEPVKLEMSQEEVVRAEERKEQNRKAAHRCRMRRKQQMSVLKEEESKLKKRRKELESQINQLYQEKQKLLLTIRSDKCALRNNSAKSKGDNSNNSSHCDTVLDLSDTDVSLTDSQEMPLNLHKDIDDESDKSENFSVVSEDSKKCVHDNTNVPKRNCNCCCRCRCHHKNITDSEGSLSDASIELDLSIDEMDKKVSSDNKLINKNNYSVPESINKSWRKRFLRSHSWESSSVISDSENNGIGAKDDLNTEDVQKTFSKGLQAFCFRTNEEKPPQITSMKNLSGPLEFMQSRVISEGDKLIYDNTNNKVINKDEVDNLQQTRRYKIANVSDNDSQYYTDSNENSPNMKVKNKYDVVFDSLKMEDREEKRPFFYTDTMK